ncbi:MAG: hypothetical protein HYX69_11120 [Planctomycetia bacterium]|nr:hypothetical protein [Planctomycetia bacterium]
MRFTSAFATIACFVLFSSTARAEVIYSGKVNIPITQNGNGTSLNLVTGQVFEGPVDFNDDWDINFFFVPTIDAIHPWKLAINKQDPILGNDFGAALAGSYHYSAKFCSIRSGVGRSGECRERRVSCVLCGCGSGVPTRCVSACI